MLSLRPGDKYWREEPDLHRARASLVAGVVVRPTSLRYVQRLYHVCINVCMYVRTQVFVCVVYVGVGVLLCMYVCMYVGRSLHGLGLATGSGM